SRSPAAGAPASDCPTRRRVRPAGPDVTANPSIALLANGGTSTRAIRGLARTRPRASATGTTSVGRARQASRTRARASWRETAIATHHRCLPMLPGDPGGGSATGGGGGADRDGADLGGLVDPEGGCRRGRQVVAH